MGWGGTDLTSEERMGNVSDGKKEKLLASHWLCSRWTCGDWIWLTLFKKEQVVESHKEGTSVQISQRRTKCSNLTGSLLIYNWTDLTRSRLAVWSLSSLGSPAEPARSSPADMQIKPNVLEFFYAFARVCVFFVTRSWKAGVRMRWGWKRLKSIQSDTKYPIWRCH